MRFNLPFKLAGVAGLFLVLDASGYADVLPGPALPQTVSKALSTRPTQTAPVAAPVVNAPEEKAPGLGEAAQKIKFQLNGIILEDNRIYSDAQLRPLFKDKLHKNISVAELFEIVQSITNYYRNNGYVISRAILPPQHVKSGVVKIRVIEGFIGKVDVGGQPRGARCQVQWYGDKIKACPPLEISRMEKYLLLANELPGAEVKAVLAPSKKNVGAADLTLVTTLRPVTAYLSYDNYGTRYIGPQQMTANVALNSWMVSGDNTQATFTKTPRGIMLTYTDINHSRPVTNEGMRWLIGGTRAHTHPLFVLQPQSVDGLNDNYYTSLQFPIIRTRSENLTLRTSFNYNDSSVTQLDVPLYDDHLRSFDFGGTYNFADRFLGANMLSGDFRQGLPILGYTSNQNPQTAQTSRPGGRGDYTKFALQASRLQAIKGPFSLYGLISGQWAFNPLLAAEQFTFGGSQLGRGYDVAELIGDKGLAGTLELRYDWAVQRFFINSMQIYTFYDAGAIWNLKSIAGTPTKLTGMSFGLGSRFFLTKYVSGNIMWAQPITKQVAALQATEQVTVNGITYNRGNGSAPRVFFSLVASFG